MKHVSTLLLLLLLLLLVAMPVAQANGPEPLVITPYQGGPTYYAASGQEVLIRAGWGTCTRGLARAFPNAASVSMEVSYNDDPFVTVEPPSREYWGPPQPSGGDTSACVMQVGTGWSVEWLYSLGALEAGQYDVHYLWLMTHQLPDGGDYDGDGRPDLFQIYIERDITILVE